MPFSPQTTEIRLNNLEGQKTMTKAQHTPGPWRRSGMAGKNKFTCPAIYSAKTDQTVCTLGSPRDGKPFDNAQANARLIAAAPDLLKALKRSAESLRIASETFGSEKLLSDCMHALAAIAKATGE